MDLTLNSCQSIKLMNFLNLLKAYLVLVMISLIVLIVENLFFNFNKIFKSLIHLFNQLKFDKKFNFEVVAENDY
jgi:hypothetical protein